MLNNTFTLTFEGHGTKISVTVSDETDIYGFLDTLKLLALGATYHAKSWEEAILSAAEDIECQRRSEMKYNQSNSPFQPMNEET